MHVFRPFVPHTQVARNAVITFFSAAKTTIYIFCVCNFDLQACKGKSEQQDGNCRWKRRPREDDLIENNKRNVPGDDRKRVKKKKSNRTSSGGLRASAGLPHFACPTHFPSATTLSPVRCTIPKSVRDVFPPLRFSDSPQWVLTAPPSLRDDLTPQPGVASPPLRPPCLRPRSSVSAGGCKQRAKSTFFYYYFTFCLPFFNPILPRFA